MIRTAFILSVITIFNTNFQNSVYKSNSPISENSDIDGPYFFYRNDSLIANYISEINGIKSVRSESWQQSFKGQIKFLVKTDIPGKSFEVQLKQKLSNEKSEYGNVKSIFAVSDIEGNFGAFRKILEANKIIDENFNWTFGEGHLVLVGDFVDRGDMVMEVLWLIYSLEEKAKAAGGYVHFVLGNHEIMNMEGDTSYVQEKYIHHAGLMNKSYMDLFSEHTEIGRWLSTKNIVERIGKVMFTHGGFSSYMNKLAMSLKGMNELARPFFRDTTFDFKDDRVALLFSDYGPFWYRGYYMSPRAKIDQVDSTLDNWNCKQIVTGHTIIANEIRSLFNGKLYDTDVHHSEGFSEALLIENGNFWRVNAKGEKNTIAPIR